MNLYINVINVGLFYAQVVNKEGLIAKTALKVKQVVMVIYAKEIKFDVTQVMKDKVK